MTQQVKNMKIRIKDEQHSRLVQETLFEMGYKWETIGQVVHYTDKAFLYAANNGYLSHGILIETFDMDEAEEVELITTYSIKPVDQEAKRKRKEKKALEKGIAAMQKQLDEMKQKLEKM